MIEISPEFLANVLGTSPGEITNALKEGEAFKPQAEVEDFVKKSIDDLLIKAKNSGKSEGKKWGEKDSLAAKEVALKAKFGVEGNNIEEIVEAAVEAASKHSKLNPDDVKNSEVYINDTKRLKSLLKEKEDEIESTKSSFAKAETMRVVKEHTPAILEKHKFVLPEVLEIRNENLSDLFRKLEDDHTRLKVEGDKILVLDANGRPKENESGTKELTFEDLLVSKAKRQFLQAVADNRQSPANKNTVDKPGSSDPDMPEMKNTGDLIKALNNERDSAKQKAIKSHFDKLVEDGTIT